MGDYLSTPIMEKAIETGENGKLKYAAVSMQGWRRSQEDAHISKVDIGEGNALFAVFDGHGGSEVSKFVERHFVRELKQLDAYKKKDYKTALQECFLKMDQIMMQPKGRVELGKLQNGSNYSEDQTTFAGTTANVLLVTKNELYCANAGDSRCVLSKRGMAKELS